jgi:hypothetical protein
MKMPRWLLSTDTRRASSVPRPSIHKHLKTFSLALLTIFLGTLLAPSRAEKVDIFPAQLRDTATHVIVGTVLQVFQRQVRDETWDTTYYVAETRITGVEKGTGLEKGTLVYVRYWTRGFRQGDPLLHLKHGPDTNGHRGLPKDGETLRIYLAQNAYDGFGYGNNDGGFNVIGANGFERLK